MKIIYEDSNGRENENRMNKKTSGASFSRSDVPPAVRSVRSSKSTKKETQHISAGVPDEKSVSDEKPQPEKPQNEQPAPEPEFKLTDEQVAILLRQYLNANPDLAAKAESAQAEPQPQSKELTPASGKKSAGTRIVFQSPDFDLPEDAMPKQPRGGIVIPTVDDYDYDEDDELDEEDFYPAPQPPRTLPRAGSVAIDYVVDEIDISTPKKPSNLNVLNNSREKTAPKAGQAVPKSLVVEEVAQDAPQTPGKKKPSVAEIIRLVVLSASVLAIIISLAVLLREYKLHKDNQKLESGISDLIISDDETTTKSSGATKKNEEKSTTMSTEQKWAKIREEYPNTVFPQNIQLKYAKLYATNNDFVGYLEAKGVNLSLPVVQTNNDDTYLEKNFYGQSTKYGCPFVTYLNKIEPLDLNTVIFGHHMNDKTIFGALDHYKSIDGFKSAPVITFNTLYKNYKWKVIAAFITNAEEKDDNGYVFQYYFTSLSTQERFSAYLNELAQRSLYDTGVDVLPTDKLLTLSTCSHEFEDARFVVVARLVRPGESAEVDTSKAAVNSNPRYPQAYYTAKKLTNPYYDASRWYIG